MFMPVIILFGVAINTTSLSLNMVYLIKLTTFSYLILFWQPYFYQKALQNTVFYDNYNLKCYHHNSMVFYICYLLL